MMIRGRVVGLIAMGIAMLALTGAPTAHAGKRDRRCHRDTQCNGGECNDAGKCCRADEIACGGTCCNKLIADACCDGKCVDFSGDENNCGGCGTVCELGKDCVDGECVCLPDEVDCGNKCANLLFDHDNCGTCGNACAADEGCFLGECRCPDPTQDYCDGQCVSLGSNDNCGWCGNKCLFGRECVAGQCEDPCGPCEDHVDGACVPKDGQTECNGACVNTQSDPNNCGGCGNVCPNSGGCQDGVCTPCPKWIDYNWCPADLGGDIIGVCCRPETPQCCFTADHGGSCCAENETCCDGYCCGAGTHCCPNSRHTYACIPDGQQCPE